DVIGYGVIGYGVAGYGVVGDCVQRLIRQRSSDNASPDNASPTTEGFSMTMQANIDRREFVTTTGAAVAAAALGPTIRIRRREKTLKILQWSHFVPTYD